MAVGQQESALLMDVLEGFQILKKSVVSRVEVRFFTPSENY